MSEHGVARALRLEDDVIRPLDVARHHLALTAEVLPSDVLPDPQLVHGEPIRYCCASG